MRNTRLVMMALAVVIAALALPAAAERKPKGSKRSDPALIHKLYVGTTSTAQLESGLESEYFAPDGSYQAISGGETLGIGKWYVTKRGSLCNEAEWYYVRKGVLKPKRLKTCLHHVTDPYGVVWMQNPILSRGWFPQEFVRSGTYAKGNPNRKTFERLKAEKGITP